MAGIEQNPDVPQSLKDNANTRLAAGAPYISQEDAAVALEEAGVPEDQAGVILAQNEASQIEGLRAALSILALMGVIALFFTGRIPMRQPGSEPT